MKLIIIKYSLIFCFLSFFISCRKSLNCENKTEEINYFRTITCQCDFDYLQGHPLSEKYGQCKSVKLVFRLDSNVLYFTNSKKYQFHYDFCQHELNDNQDIGSFNKINYQNIGNRKYIFANLNYYSASDIISLEFFNDDELTPNQIKMVFDSVAINISKFKSNLRILSNFNSCIQAMKEFPNLPVVNVNEIYGNQIYQSLTNGKTYGYLRMVDKKDFKQFNFNIHDIVVLNSLPNDLPVVAGILTVPFQTPLSHISILSANRNTPNAAFKTAFTDPIISNLENKLVEYIVTAEDFSIRDASNELKVIKSIWDSQQNHSKIKLAFDTTFKSLLSVSKLQIKDVNIVGAKAANMGELSKIKVDKYKRIPLPEMAFAIPFYWYKQHLIENNIQAKLDSIIKNNSIFNNPNLLSNNLKLVQKLIKDAPLNVQLIRLIESKLTKNNLNYIAFRFRSSTNAEDIKGFNGAGLYDSKTVILKNQNKSIEKAVKQIWASLWNERAFKERSYFGFDQSTIFMGILVHRSFGTEIANGVALTKHLYRKSYPAFTINAQVGEVSVVYPADSIVSDQFIVYSGSLKKSSNISCEYICHSNITNGIPVLNQNQIEELVMYLKAIKTHFYYLDHEFPGLEAFEFDDFGVDVEFKIDAGSNKLYIKQARLY